MPTTTNFGWTTPADTDLVKDGASAMRTLGNGIDTSLVYLKGGTTGQILSKTSNTDLAFTWINNDQGDITAVTAGTGLSGGGTTGAVSLAIDTATTVDKTTAQTLTNKTMSGSSNTFSNISLTSSVTGTLPIGNGGTNLTTYTTGDLPYASATNTLSKLAIGTTGQVLTVSGGVPTWASAAAGGGKVLQVVSTTKTDTFSTSTNNSYVDVTGLSQAITPSATSSKILVVVSIGAFDASSIVIMAAQLVRGSTAIAIGDTAGSRYRSTAGIVNAAANRPQSVTMIYLDSPSTTSSTTYKVQIRGNSDTMYINRASTDTDDSNYFRAASTITLLEIGA